MAVVDREIEISPLIREVTIELQRGDIELSSGGPSGRLRRRTGGTEGLVTSLREDSLHVRQSTGGAGAHPASRSDLLVTLPPEVKTLTVRTGHGRIDASRVEGRSTLHCQIGDVVLRESQGEASLSSDHGEVRVERFDGELTVNTGVGDIALSHARGSAELVSGHGQIDVRDCSLSEARLHCGTGDVRVCGGSVQLLRSNTGHGAVSCNADLVEGEHELSTSTGDIHVGTVRGRALVRTEHGRVSVATSQGALQARAVTGDIDLGSVTGEAAVETSHGRVQVEEVRGKLQVRAGIGDVTVRHATGELALEARHGRIDVPFPRSAVVSARTTRGDILLGDGTVARLDAETGAGSVTCRAGLGAGEHRIESRQGDLSIWLAAEPNTRVDAQTAQGQVQTFFPMVRVGRSGGANGVRMVGSTVDDVAHVSLLALTGRGQIHLRESPGSARRSHPEPREPRNERGGPRVLAGLVDEPPPDARRPDEGMDSRPATIATHAEQGETSSPAAVGRESRAWALLKAPGPRQAPADAPVDPVSVILEALARGELTPEEADELLAGHI